MGAIDQKEMDENDFLTQFVGEKEEILNPGLVEVTPTAAPSAAAGPDLDFLSAVATGDLDDIETSFSEAIKSKGAEKKPEAKTLKQMEQKAGLVADSAAGLYVETVDLCLGIVCSIIAGSETSKPYEIPSDKKEQYQRIASQYFESINYEANPGTYFAFATIVILAGPIYKAYNDRKERLKVSAFASARQKMREKAAIPDETQTTLFDEKTISAMKQPPRRKRFEHDEDGFYMYSAPENGSAAYLKKEARTDAVPANIASFFREFEARHGRKPTNKEVTTYIMSI